ncbi:putative up-regulator of cell proliferation-like [Apostichopus japonicus]|uniref:Putative up-regulator of cell proliferation-like n=1 Tax=Stichopus japonicus TaxID=307972 RepID=A0A2G8JWE8_STIJA|nr:putative up-regulator of cell proliferation-like [Apostichopus japonicus]
MDALADRVSWTEVQAYMDIFSVDIIDQMTKLVDTVKDLVPVEVVEMLVGLSEENIQKFANMVPTEDTRPTLDKCFMMELPMLERQDVHIVLAIVAEARQTFLAQIKSNGSYSPTIMRDFKTLCDGTCKDHIAAKSFSSIIEESLKQCLQNRICTAMFEQLSKAGDEIFCSRPRFLKAVLENLCKEEDFKNYIGFLRQHSRFLQKWTLSFIAKECCVETENCIRIKDIAMHEIGEILRETGVSLDATLRSLRAESEGDISFEKWVKTFTEYFEKSVKSSLNKEEIFEMIMYTVISDYNVFGAECKNLVQNTMQPKLLQHADLPDTSCIESIKEWFEDLPKQLHIVLAYEMQGCGTQCPFCKTLCDDTVKEHKVHFSNLHFPSGVGGWRGRSSRQLVCDTCTANVASSNMYYTCHCPGRTCAHSPKPYKEYRIDYPEWDIKPISNYEATLYWKWVFSRFNNDFARYYNCKRASIPWGRVTKEEALSSIRNDT